jgi:hypothetical protein
MAGAPADLVGDLCPTCGSRLEPVSELAELLGYRLIKPPESAPGANTPDGREGTAERLDEFLARQEATLAQDRLDALRWVDDGGSFRSEAVALPRPETNP